LSAVTQTADAVALINKQLAVGTTLAPLTIGRGAAINVDPGQSINLNAWGQIDVEGALNAPGGTINILNTRPFGFEKSPDLPLSIWIGDTASVDVAGTAVMAPDQYGRTFGIVQNGGTITLGSLGGTRSSAGVLPSTEASIIVRPGAVLDASGASATLDLS